MGNLVQASVSWWCSRKSLYLKTYLKYITTHHKITQQPNFLKNHQSV